ncbi:hypothetical protein ACE4Z6_27685, partial [Salmonella enterica]|uniref:hypothetical protein n=1 Tax=Salmonella enterica TaxID=28901 RepID=UPI003D28FF49
GFEMATGDILAMLDNDTEVQPGGVQKLADEAWRVGISCIQSCRLSTDLNYIGDTDAYGADYPCGSALFIRRDVWEKVGRLDEQF